MIANKITYSLAALIVAAAPAFAEELKFANFMAPGHPYVANVFEPFAASVAAATGDAVTVKLYNGGELGAGPVDQYARVTDGVAELAIGLPGYAASNFPLTLLTELPGAVSEATGTAEINAHLELFADEYRRAHLVSLWTNAENILFTVSKPVHTPADIAGLKIRVPSRNTGLLVEAWGASPVSMPVSEIYNALQTGVIDGAMIDGTAVGAFKLAEVTNYITTGMDTTISPFFILMNRDAYDALTDEQKAAVDAAGQQAALDGQAVQVGGAAKGLADFAAIEGKQVITLTDDEAAAFDTLAAGVIPAVVAETGGNAQTIVDTLMAE